MSPVKRIIPEPVRAAVMRMLWRLHGALGRAIGAAPAAKADAEEWRWESHSQEGEDMVLWYLLDHQAEGFYVDVGAHHPVRFSNTCFFNRAGWRGLNIDADPDAVKALEEARPGDINLHVGVGMEDGELEFVRYFERALNTFDKELVEQRKREGIPFEIAETIRVEVRPLAAILRDHLDPGHAIDFLSVDVEGRDLDALRSNDWEAFRPRFVLVECINTDLTTIQGNESTEFLAAQGYRGIAKTANTAFFREA